MGSSIVSLQAWDKSRLDAFLCVTEDLKAARSQRAQVLEGKVVGSLFFQPSIRTRLGFEVAAQKLGARCVGFASIEESRSKVGYDETPEDCVRTVSSFTDCVIVRHFQTGFCRDTAETLSCPMINAGDGWNEHPSQGLIDLFTLRSRLGDLSGATIGIVGRPAARSHKSLLWALAKYNVKSVHFLLPPDEILTEYDVAPLAGTKVQYEQVFNVSDLLVACDAIDILPVDLGDLDAQPDTLTTPHGRTPVSHRIDLSAIQRTNSRSLLLHPGPRRDELSRDTDHLSSNLMSAQVKDGVFVRMALLLEAMGPW